MSYLIKASVLLVSVSLMTSACAKKKSSRKAAPRPAASATAPETETDTAAETDADGLNRPGTDDERDEKIEMVEGRRPEPRNSRDQSNYRELPSPDDENQDYTDRNEQADLNGDYPGNGDHPTAPDTSENTTARNSQCGTAWRRNTETWAPGLPNPPSPTRICTGGSVTKQNSKETFQCEGRQGIVFTDARQDGLMAMVVDRVNKLPRQMDLGSRELGQRIRDVKVYADVNGSGAVSAEVTLLTGNRRYDKVQLRGQLRNWKGRSRADVQLRAVNAPRGLKFNAVLTCADLGNQCQNSLLRLQQLTRSGKVGRVAYVVYRHGDAHVTMSEQDRIGYRSIRNEGHARLAQYLSNTVYNTCVSILRDAFGGARQLPTCSFKRLKEQCGHSAKYKYPAAKAFVFRSWAVAYGRAGFEFEMVDGGAARFKVAGPLVASSQTPVWPRALEVKGSFASQIERAILVANDGGGNLNLQIDFRGEQKSHTRVSVTTLMEDVRFSSEQIMKEAGQMPAVAPEQIADEREQRDDIGSQDDVDTEVTDDTTADSAAQPTPVGPREEDDNQTIQPAEAPTTPPPGSDQIESEEDLGAEG